MGDSGHGALLEKGPNGGTAQEEDRKKPQDGRSGQGDLLGCTQPLSVLCVRDTMGQRGSAADFQQ